MSGKSRGCHVAEQVTDMAVSLAEETVARVEAEARLAQTWRVAVEAMRLLTREQLAELRHRLDALEVGDGGGSRD